MRPYSKLLSLLALTWFGACANERPCPQGSCLPRDAAATDGPNTPDAPPSVSAAPTWHQDVAPIVSQHCSGCHRPGGIGPFSLSTYESARPLATAMAGTARAGAMPPWHAKETDECRPRFPWKHDIRLSEAKKLTLERWAQMGAPEGDPARPAPLVAAPGLELADRSRRLTMPKPFPVEGAKDLFQCFVMPHTFTENVWVTGLQVVPGNHKVVHHVLVWLDKDRKSDALAGADGSYPCFGAPGFDAPLLGAWAPGAVPTELPPGVGIPVPKGSRIVINVHYHPSGSPEMDASSLDLRWTTTKTAWEGQLALIGNFRRTDAQGDGLMPGPNDPATGPAFRIPAGARDHVETMRFTVPKDLILGGRVFAVGTHMHYVGTDMKIEIDRSKRSGGAPKDEPTRECLLQTPEWDFHWQRGYMYDEALEKLPTAATGDVLHLRCKYDNSLENPYVKQALAEQGLSEPRTVELGEETLDEMCLGVFGVAYFRP